MATKQLYGDRNYNGDIITNHTFTVFADLAAATAVVANVYGFAFMADTGTLYYNQTGLAWQPIGAKGAKGDTGVAGNTVLSGSGAPSGITGVDGDFYIDTAAAEIYGPKTAGVWGSPTSLTGPAGPAGADGNTLLSGVGVPPPILGMDGDFYLRTDTTAMYGPKTAGAWGAPTSLVGPAGPPGDAAGVVSGAGTPESRTTTGAVDPSGAPGGTYPQFYFNTTDLTLFLWDPYALAWATTSTWYLDTETLRFYEAVEALPKGWAFVASLGGAAPITSVSSATALNRALDQTILYDVSGGAFAITLPAAPFEGDRIRFKNKTNSTNTLTITGTVDGTTDPPCTTAYQLYVVEYLGGAWRKMN